MRNLLFLLLTIFALSANSQTAMPVGVAPKVAIQAAQNGQIDVLVLLKQQADLTPAKYIQGKTAKGTWVYQTLLQQAKTTQAPLLALLQRPDVKIRPFWIVNAIHVQGPPQLLESLSTHPDVQAIVANSQYELQREIRPNPENEDLRGPSEIPWGIVQIGADQVWALGFNGQGVVVAGADTGVEWIHPALQSRYRGYTNGIEDHNFNWHDCVHDSAIGACGFDLQAPCDENSHGTHSLGTVVGTAPNESIGVAPGATWIAVRNMDNGYGTLSRYIEGFQWFIAPTDLEGNNADPAKAPHVINNSWYCSTGEGCDITNFYLMDEAVIATRAAGIVPVISVGNEGPECSSANGPPGFMASAFSIGASNTEDKVAGFSSRGPVIIDESGRLRPDVVAPGVGIRSAVTFGEYGNKNGTSMAGPHVAGLVALMISAKPELAGEVALIESIIRETAVPIVDSVECGNLSVGTIPNNAAGYGRINALAAVSTALTSTQSIVNQALTIWPNPAQETVNVTFDALSTDSELLVLDMLGRVVIQQKLPANTQYAQFSVSLLPKGHFVLRLQGPSVLLSRIIEVR